MVLKMFELFAVYSNRWHKVFAKCPAGAKCSYAVRVCDAKRAVCKSLTCESYKNKQVRDLQTNRIALKMLAGIENDKTLNA